MRIISAVLLGAVLLLLWQVVTIRQGYEDQSKKVQELTARLNEKEKQDQLELQEKCALRAEKIFRSMGYKLDADGLQSHYHPKMGHCFMVIAPFPKSNPDGSIITFKYLLDAYEQKSLAEYAWKSQNDKKYWEVKPFICKLTRATGNEVACNSDEEFEKFVASYME